MVTDGNSDRFWQLWNKLKSILRVNHLNGTSSLSEKGKITIRIVMTSHRKYETIA